MKIIPTEEIHQIYFKEVCIDVYEEDRGLRRGYGSKSISKRFAKRLTKRFAERFTKRFTKRFAEMFTERFTERFPNQFRIED